MTDSYDKDIDVAIKAIRRIDAEADEIRSLIKHLSELDQESREKVLATVMAYYELGEAGDPAWLKVIQSTMAATNEQMQKLVEEGVPRGAPIPRASGADVLYGEARDDEERSLRALAFNFSRAMFEKMLEKYREDGYHGWDVDSTESVATLIRNLESHLAEPDCYSESNLVDIANFCAFIWHHRRKS